ncbi:MAG: right-handed parallel beta-helix repeat-containing protein, partial [Methanosarcinales archaeon]|nr:right-handed parallel beta-helix repeat-containing protein [Methanosarcinales archaeon]
PPSRSSTPHTNYLGNYWSDYSGVDTSPEDGLGDAPYDIPGSATDKDHRPLMEGFENYPASAATEEPDLTPTSIATDSLSAGVPAAITVDVSNIGSAEAGSFNVSLKVEDTVIGSDTVASLGAGSSVPVVFTWTPDAAGSFNLTAIVDSDDAVAESDEANNERTNEVTVTPAAAFEPGECDITVGPSGCDYSSIQDAVVAATDGDTICVYAGTYGGYDVRIGQGATVPISNLTIKGEGADVVTFDGGSEYEFIIGDGVDTPGCILEGFTFKGAVVAKDLVRSYAPNSIIRDCVFEGLTTSFALDFAVCNLTFANNTIANATGSQTLVVPINGSTIVGNTFINCPGNAIVLFRQNPAPGGIIARNNITSTEGKGIWLYNAGEGNRIYLNNFVDNPGGNVGYSGTPPTTIYWNSTEP